MKTTQPTETRAPASTERAIQRTSREYTIGEIVRVAGRFWSVTYTAFEARCEDLGIYEDTYVAYVRPATAEESTAETARRAR